VRPFRRPRRRDAMSDGRYLVVRQNDAWFIKFEDEEYGPYWSETEAMGFAVDAARKLSACGEHPEVCVYGAFSAEVDTPAQKMRPGK
jgi:hypothetical protein